MNNQERLEAIQKREYPPGAVDDAVMTGAWNFVVRVNVQLPGENREKNLAFALRTIDPETKTAIVLGGGVNDAATLRGAITAALDLLSNFERSLTDVPDEQINAE